MKLLFIDTETGGLDCEIHSLFSIGLAVWDDGKIVYSNEFYVKNDVYAVTPSALKVNHIDIIEAHEKSCDKNDIISEFKMIKDFYFGGERITVAGHNVAFDIGFIKKMYADCDKDYSFDFAHRTIDTACILKYLYLAGALPEDISSSDKAFTYYNIIDNNSDERHTALGDCLATAELFNKLL